MSNELISWIDQDKDRIIEFLQSIVKEPSPTPPGDTVAVMKHITQLLDTYELPYELYSKDESMPNLVATIGNDDSDKHLVLNGHIDVFPVETASDWTYDPWGGEVREGRLYGRGVADMKVGTNASIWTFIYLSRLRAQLDGKLTLTVVSDEERLGPNGARYLFDKYAEKITGTACLNGEPSSKHTVRLGEKGAAWVNFSIKTPGSHAAYPHQSKSSIHLACELISDLRAFADYRFEECPKFVDAIMSSKDALERANGVGAERVARSILVNVGTIKGGAAVNMVAANCQFNVDFRLPAGVKSDQLIEYIEYLKKFHDFQYEVERVDEPNFSDENCDLARAVRTNAEKVTGIPSMTAIGLGNTDARLWRYKGVPAIVYGASPLTMGSIDENVPVDEVIDIVKVHALSAYDYLSGRE